MAAEVAATEKIPQFCPRGFHPVKVDANGRTKLPASYKRYVETRPDTTLFFTIILGAPRIFTNGSFQRLLESVEDESARDEIAMSADMDGENLEVDAQGRVTFPTSKRKPLGLEDCTIWLRYDKDVITVFSGPEYEKLRAGIEAAKRDIDIRARQGGFRL
jgi:DNA-binding transcriptional regulator/RsmH inhibitor MraZ